MKQTVKLILTGLDCPDCAARLESNIRHFGGVEECAVDVALGSVRIDYESSIVAPEQLIRQIDKLGHKAIAEPQAGKRSEKTDLIADLRIKKLFLLFALGTLGLQGLATLLGWPESLRIGFGLMTVIGGGWFVFRSALSALKRFSADMNLLMTIAVLGALILGDWSEAAVTMVLFSLANYLEGRSVRKARRAFGSLTEKVPQEIECETPEGSRIVPIMDLIPGDLIYLKPGMTCPTDCEILEGSAYINQASVTGESRPISKNAGDKILGGSINIDGSLKLRALKPFADSTLSRIIHMVEESSGRKARLASLVDRFARVYTPVVVGLAILVATVIPAVFSQNFATWFYRALVFLVIACPCALVIATPVAVICSLTRAAREGILIKGGVFLEKLAGLQGVLFDKTGTLTMGKFQVAQIISGDGYAEAEIISIAASIEKRSEHSIARAIGDHAANNHIGTEKISDFRAYPGEGAQARLNGRLFLLGSHRFFHGRMSCPEALHDRIVEIEGKGQTVAMLSGDGQIMGAIALTDQLKPEAAEAIRETKHLGIPNLVMVTGDNHETAQAVADKLGIELVNSQVLPLEKNHLVQEYQKRFGPMAMVGDGINDAPALATAEVGIAMGTGGSDLAIEAADVAIIGDNPVLVPKAIKLARNALSIIKFNIVFALAAKLIFMILAILGLATLWMAVAADMGVSLLVIFNSMRLLRE